MMTETVKSIKDTVGYYLSVSWYYVSDMIEYYGKYIHPLAIDGIEEECDYDIDTIDMEVLDIEEKLEEESEEEGYELQEGTLEGGFHIDD